MKYSFFYKFIIVDIIRFSVAGWLKKLKGPHMALGP